MKLTLKQLLEQSKKKVSIPMDGILSSMFGNIDKVLTEAMEKAIDEFRSEAEQMTKTLIEEVQTKIEEVQIKVNESESYVRSLKPSKGDKGDTYTLTDLDKKEIGRKITVPIVEKVIEKTEVIKELPIVKEVALPIEGKEIVDKVNELPIQPKFQIDWKHIKGIPQKLYDERKISGRLGRGTGHMGQIATLTSELNGSTKIFTIPANRRVILVVGTSAPFYFTPTTDYTVSGIDNVTLTFTDNVNASVALAEDQAVGIVYIEA